MHDLVSVAVLDAHLAERRARHDRQVPLDRDPRRIEPELAQHAGDADPARDSALLAIHPDFKALVDAH